MSALKSFFTAVLFVCAGPLWAADKVTVAAAADLKFALEEVVATFNRTHPGKTVETIYGSSGKFYTQIRQGAPFDMYFSADIAYPRLLEKDGFAASPTERYAIGRIVLWSQTRDASKMTLADLAAPSIRKIAIANPKHAPYGKRAEEALRVAGVWDTVQDRLVLGENIAQTAQFVQTGNADIGIIALALALNKELAVKGGYALIDDKLHESLDQGFIITKRAAANKLAKQFAAYMGSPEARRIMVNYGFALPGEK
ncbi:MAG: molybdate ABC transporter substrate-binding protein [Rhodocyclaceae bacterium]|nr:molybdate ABC transporter substrate-binding protein [Rhodocyclaceae bacterium]MDZ4213203.1 molybdate ABC transporter substrate-binding protein [Rhodocyclaceae bacterium]